MIHVAIHKAKTELTKLLPLAEAGEEVVITRHGKPVATLGPYRPNRGGLDFSVLAVAKARAGWAKGAIMIADDFDAPLPESSWLPDDPARC